MAIRRFSIVFSGATPDRSNMLYWTNGTIPWLSSGDVNLRQIKETSQFITEQGFKASSTKWIKPGSLVVALAGQGKTKGMVATVEITTTCNQSLGVVEPNKKKIDYRFLAYYLESRYIDIRSLVGDGLRDGLNLEHIKSIVSPVPPIEEQRQIVSFIDRESEKLVKASSLIESQIDQLKEYRSSLIYSAVTGKIKV